MSKSRAIRPSRAFALAATLALGLALPAPADALEQRLVAPDGANRDEFGWSVAIDGDTAAVGAPNAGGARGAVYVFTRSGDSWRQTAKLTASDGAAEDRLGTSVAIDGDTVVAGAPAQPGSPSASDNPGAAYTFARTGAPARTETAKLTASDGLAHDGLGFSVAIDGDTIVAGGGCLICVGVRKGAVYTFSRSGAPARTQTAKLTASDGEVGDGVGFSVAIDGDMIVAGAPWDDVRWEVQGSIYRARARFDHAGQSAAAGH